MQRRIDKNFFKNKSIPIDLFLDKILYHKKLGYYQKKNPFGPQDPNIGTSDYQGGGGGGGNIQGSISRGGTDDTPGTPF